MKRFRKYLLLSLLFSVASCGLNDPIPAPADNGAELSFRATAPATKGFVTGTELEDDATGARTLTISAFLHPQTGREENYFTGETFSLSDGRWRHNPALYWPIGAQMDFLAYSSTRPFATFDGEWGTARWGMPDASERFRLAVGQDRTQDDILFGGLYHQTTPQDGTLNLVMNHSQAWIEVQLTKNETVTGDVIVRSVKLSDVYLYGDLDVMNNYGNPTASWNFRRSHTQDVQVDDPMSLMGRALGDGTSSLSMLIPEQDMTTLTIEYTMGGEDKTWSKELDASTWLMGRHYIYAVAFDQPALGDLTLVITEEPWNAGREFASYAEVLLGNMLYATGSSVDIVYDGFDLSAESKVYWRQNAEREYTELEYHDGTWGTSVDYEHEEWDINVRSLLIGDGAYNVTATRDLVRSPLTLDVTEPGVLYWKAANSSKTIEYSLNGQPWASITSTTDGTPLALAAGDEVRFRGNNASYSNGSNQWNWFSSDGIVRFNLSGNVTSMLDPDGYKDMDAITGNFALRGLFRYNAGVVDAGDLVMNVKTVPRGCYAEMFNNCSNMTVAPREILAENGSEELFEYMFYQCTSLVQAPARFYMADCARQTFFHMFDGCKVLTTCPSGLENVETASNTEETFAYMFAGCTVLTENVPERLSLETVGVSTYSCMFQSSGITRAPEIMATMANKQSFYRMFGWCSSLVTPPSEIKVKDFSTSTCNGMFRSCTSLTRAPRMTVNSVAQESFLEAFRASGITSAADIEWNASDLKVGSCYAMFTECSSLPTAMVMEITSVMKNSCFQMYRYCSNLTSAPVTFTVTDLSPGENCFNGMFTGTKLPAAVPMEISATGSFCCCEMYLNCKSMTDASGVVLSATSLSSGSYNCMFQSCEQLVTGPASIDAESYGERSCQRMFYRCYNLPATPVMEIKQTGSQCCNSMFHDCTKMTDNNVTFSCQVVETRAFSDMFNNCQKLTTCTPLTVDQVKDYGCYNMYRGCKALVNLPASLPAMTLGVHAYRGMFMLCTAMTTAPNLPATTASTSIYEEMFQSCTGLIHGPSVMALTKTAWTCCRYMFDGCTNMVDCFTDIAATRAAEACFNWMFRNCKKLLAGPQLHLTEIADAVSLSAGWMGSCYGMFEGCQSMVTGPTDFGTAKPGTHCFERMFYDCKALTTAPASMSSEAMAEYCYRQMFYCCESLTTAPSLPSLQMAPYCCAGMFQRCHGLSAFPELPATTLAKCCYEYMFAIVSRDYAKITVGPSLPSATLEENCYKHMFECQYKMASIRMSATNVTAANALQNWLLNASPTGTITLSTGVTLPTGVSGVPSGWTIVYE